MAESNIAAEGIERPNTSLGMDAGLRQSLKDRAERQMTKIGAKAEAVNNAQALTRMHKLHSHTHISIAT